MGNCIRRAEFRAQLHPQRGRSDLLVADPPIPRVRAAPAGPRGRSTGRLGTDQLPLGPTMPTAASRFCIGCCPPSGRSAALVDLCQHALPAILAALPGISEHREQARRGADTPCGETKATQWRLTFPTRGEDVARWARPATPPPASPLDREPHPAPPPAWRDAVGEGIRARRAASPELADTITYLSDGAASTAPLLTKQGG